MKKYPKVGIVLLNLLLFFAIPKPAAAYYDPGVQRWLNRDPVGEPGFERSCGRQARPLSNEPNLYTYVHNDPANRADAYGLWCFEIYRCCAALPAGTLQCKPLLSVGTTCSPSPTTITVPIVIWCLVIFPNLGCIAVPAWY